MSVCMYRTCMYMYICMYVCVCMYVYTCRYVYIAISNTTH